MKSNPGQIPDDARGKRVIVTLRNGRVCGRDPVGAALPNGWAADGREGCRWSRGNSPWDIVAYEVVG
jgi:hypothetical protein